MRAPAPHRGLLSRILRWIATALWRVCQGLLIVWAALAIYYSNLPWGELRLALSVVFAAFAGWALWVSRQRRMQAAFALLFLGLAAPMVRNRRDWVVAAAAVLASVLAALVLPQAWQITTAAVAASAVGMALGD